VLPRLKGLTSMFGGGPAAWQAVTVTSSMAKPVYWTDESLSRWNKSSVCCPA